MKWVEVLRLLMIAHHREEGVGGKGDELGEPRADARDQA